MDDVIGLANLVSTVIMHEPASRELVARLEEFTACRERDLLECRGFVRQLSRDLPAFDSIWLDALVQARRLTPFQADRLATGREATLKVGRYQLVSQLMQDRVHVRYLGRDPRTGGRLFIEEFLLAGAPTDSLRASLRETRERLNRLPEVSRILPPLEYVVQTDRLFAITPYERGLTARELLIRRGRFPEKLVRSLSRGLMQQLRILSSAALVHGDLRAANVLLNPRGEVLLLNAGIRPCLSAHWTLQTPLPYESYDTLPPEVVKTGAWSPAGDLYSTGCLLWQFACGRPPLHSADPLLKIRTHLEKSIPDPREFAPDLDTETATRIFQLTRRSPQERGANRVPRGDSEGVRGVERLQVGRFVREFEQPPPGWSPSRPALLRKQILVPLAAVFLGALVGWIGWNYSGPPSAGTATAGNSWLTGFLTASTTTESPPQQASQETASTPETTADLLPLPKPDARGRIALEPGRRYRATDLSVVGPLTISLAGDNAPTTTGQAPQESAEERPDSRAAFETAGAQQPNAIVVIGEQPWRVWATELTLQNITLVHQAAPETTAELNLSVAGKQPPRLLPGATTETPPKQPPALLVCQSLNLRAQRCRWLVEQEPSASPTPLDHSLIALAAHVTPETSSRQRTPSLRGIAWKPLESTEVQSGQLELTDCEFLLPGSGIMLGGHTRRLVLQNCLKTGPGDFLEASDQFLTRRPLQARFEHVTLRGADSLLNVHFFGEGKPAEIDLKLQATNCVLHLRESATGLITLTGTDNPLARLRELQLEGQILLCQEDRPLVSWHHPETGRLTPLSPPGEVEGILLQAITFAGPDEHRSADSQIHDYTGPRWNSASPGIQPARLPREHPTPP